MLDDDPGNPPGTDPGTRGQGTAGDDSATVIAEPGADLSPWAPLLGMLDATEPARRSIPENSDGRPVSDTYEDVDELQTRRRLAQAGYDKRAFNDSTIDDDSM